ncbi:MAG: thiamine phosphate synthase [Sandaracinus sp.]
MKGLYAIVDPRACAGRDPVSVAGAILRGGCAALQLRDKAGSDRRVLALARELAPLAREAGVPFFVDDRLDVAIACDADGVHLGQDDLPLAVARAQAPRLRVGISTHTPAQREAAEREGADLVGYGPVFATATKENPDAVVGLDGVAAAVRAARVPVVAIGGITLARVPALREAGVSLAAVISAVCGAPDPEAEARALHRALRGEPA